MEHEVARRRVGRTLDHLTGPDELAPPDAHLSPINCSSTLNTMIRRHDNRVLFARQGSASQGYFMQQNYEAGASSQQNLAFHCSCTRNGDCFFQHSGEPMFSRVAQRGSALLSSRDDQPVKHEMTPSSNDVPKFAKPDSQKSMEWSPRMDVAESGPNYVVTVELPGVNIIEIQVEVDERNLTVMGNRSTLQRKVPSGSETLKPIYHRREISQGPYRVVWPLPNDVNKDSVSAEFVDGFLYITLPKL